MNKKNISDNTENNTVANHKNPDNNLDKNLETNTAKKLREFNLVLDEGVDFTIEVEKQNILHKLKLLPKEKKFIIRPLKLGALINISKLFLEIGEAEIGEQSVFQEGIKNMRHVETFAKVIAVAIINKQEKPSKKLVNFLIKNLTAGELLKIVNLVVKQMDISSFFFAVVAIKGIDMTSGPKPSGVQSEGS